MVFICSLVVAVGLERSLKAFRTCTALCWRRLASHHVSGKCAEQFLSQFSRPPHAENEQGRADKMQKCTVGRVACGCAAMAIQAKSCRKTKHNPESCSINMRPAITMAMHPAQPASAGHDLGASCFHAGGISSFKQPQRSRIVAKPRINGFTQLEIRGCDAAVALLRHAF